MKTKMMWLVVLCLALAFPVIVLAEAAPTMSNSQGQNQGQVQSQSNGVATSNVQTGVTMAERTPPPNIGLPSFYYPWMERRPIFWNGSFVDPNTLQRKWKLEEIKSVMKSLKPLGPIEALRDNYWKARGFPFELAMYDKSARKEGKPICTVVPSNLIPDFYKKFGRVGSVHLLASTRRTSDQTIVCALDIVAPFDWDIAVIWVGINPVYHGSAFSPGAGVAQSGTSYSFSVVSGYTSSDSTILGEPFVVLELFREDYALEQQELPDNVRAFLK
jgi:hypothetical protein